MEALAIDSYLHLKQRFQPPYDPGPSFRRPSFVFSGADSIDLGPWTSWMENVRNPLLARSNFMIYVWQ